jgi:hypothetical protein
MQNPLDSDTQAPMTIGFKDLETQSIPMKPHQSRDTGALAEPLPSRWIVNKGGDGPRKSHIIPGGNPDGVNVGGNQFAATHSARDNYGATTRHALGDSQAKGLGLRAGMNNDIKGLVHRGRIFLKPNKTQLTSGQQHRTDLAQLHL